MKFQLQKKRVLADLDSGPDASRKGDVDARIVPLLKEINALADYYTTSSCAGRIMLLEENSVRKDTNWLFSSHEPATQAELVSGLKNSTGNMVWFRFESMILHVCAQDCLSAERLLQAARSAGLKRAGAIALLSKTRDGVMIEITGNQRMNLPIMQDNKLLFPESYLEVLAKQANLKFQENNRRILLFTEQIEKLSFRNI